MADGKGRSVKKLSIFLALGLLLISVPVFGFYYAYLEVTESNGTTYEDLALTYAVNVTYLVDEGYIAANGTDTRITDSDFTALPHMLADDRLLWVGDVAANDKTQFVFVTEQDYLSAFPVITGYGGYVMVPDNASIELGDVWAIYIVGYVDTSSAARGPIIEKTAAINFDVTAVGELTFNITGGVALSETAVAADWMTLLIWCDGYETHFEINDVEVDTDVAASIPDTSNNWTLFQNDCMPYVTYYGTWVA